MNALLPFPVRRKSSVAAGAITGLSPGGVAFGGPSGGLTQDLTNFFWDDANDRLGIGTATPNSTLEVNGPIRITRAQGANDLVINPESSGEPVYKINLGGTFAFGIRSNGTLQLGTAGLITDIGTVEIDDTNGVHRGNFKLVYFDAGGQLLLQSGHTAANFAVGRTAFNFDTSEAISTSDLVRFKNDGSTLFTLDSSGNVGIGTDPPGSKIDINGDLNQRGIAAPALSPADQGRIYFDSTAKKFKASENGGAYVNLIGAPGSDTTAFHTGGDSFGALATIGTNDGFDLAVETAGVERFRVLITGQIVHGATSLINLEKISVQATNDGDVEFLRGRNPNTGTSARGIMAIRNDLGEVFWGATGSNNTGPFGANLGFLNAGGGLDGLLLRSVKTGAPLIFATEATNRARFLGGGQLLLNKTTLTNAGQLEVSGKIFASGELEIDGDINFNGANIGVHGATPVPQATITGSRAANAALASLLTSLATRGDIIDSTTA